MRVQRKLRLRGGVLATTTVAVSVLTGCSLLPVEKSIDIDAEDVVRVEMFQYTWGDESGATRRVAIDPRGYGERSNGVERDSQVSMFTRMPTTVIDFDVADAISGEEALGVRYHLADGTSKEITRVFLGYHDVVVFWPDGDVRHTEWGSPGLVDELCELDSEYEFLSCDEATPSERPKVALPS